MDEKVIATTAAELTDVDEIAREPRDNVREKNGASATTTALLSDESNCFADESASCKPDKNLTAAIWTIVCGVALPCIPVIVVSAVLLWLVLSNRIHPKTGLPELQSPVEHDRCSGFIDCVGYARHHAGPAYYVDGNPSTITTIASWTSRVIPYLTSSIMALVAFFAARRIVTKSNHGADADLLSPEQLTLLIDLLGGKGIEPLKDTILHRWAHKKKLVDPVPMAFSALLTITLLGQVALCTSATGMLTIDRLTIPLVDTWFGIATVPASITQLLTVDEWYEKQASSTVGGHSLGFVPSDPTATDAGFMSSRVLNASMCPDGPGGFAAMAGAEWMSCNINWDESNGAGDYYTWLQGVDDAIKVLQDATFEPSNVSSYPANYTAGNVLREWDGPVYYYLDNPRARAGVDYKAKTLAISTQCSPMTIQCLRNETWPQNRWGNFSCSPGFAANFSFSGVSQLPDWDDPSLNPVGANTYLPTPAVGLAFSKDADFSNRVGAFNSSLSYDGTYRSVEGASGYEFLFPQNPLHFLAWAQGFPSLTAEQFATTNASGNPLLADHQIWQVGGATEWILNCSATVYEVTYTFVNGSIQHFNKTLASPAMGGFISAPFALDGIPPRTIALSAAAAAAGATDNSRNLATMFADHWSKAALAMSAGAMEARPNLLNQVRELRGPLARVPIIPFYLLLVLKAIYVMAVILLAIGAYCFTHPAETEIVKTQLSTRGLAAAHFDTPDILQYKVVSQLNERLQPARDDVTEVDPAKGGLKRAATFLGEIPDKKVGVVARTDGAWRFAVLANGVWNGIAPIAVDLVWMEGKAGNLGDAGDLVKAWMR